jgi:Cu-processing system permease protein
MKALRYSIDAAIPDGESTVIGTIGADSERLDVAVGRPGHLRAIYLLAVKEFSDRFRSGWVIASAAVWLGAICLTSFFGLVQIGQLGVQGYERTVVSLLNLVQYLVPLLGLLIGHDLVVAEREDRTLALLLSTGLSRVVLLTGKFLGGVLTIFFPLVLGFVISGVVIGLNASSAGLVGFIKLALSGLILGAIFVAAGLAISIFLRTRVQALVAAL